MKKFLGLIILMGQVKKENIRNYWSTDPTISMPICHHSMSRNRWQAVHFSDNSQQVEHSGWLFKIWSVYEYFVKKFRSVCSPKQELSLDEAMNPWRGRLKFRTYNPRKITKIWSVGERQYRGLSATWRYTQLRERSWRTQCYHF